MFLSVLYIEPVRRRRSAGFIWRSNPSLPITEGPRWPGAVTVPRSSPAVTDPIAMTFFSLR